MMKLMYKGAVKDDCKTLGELRVTSGAKMMVVGSTVTEVMEVATSVPGTDAKQKDESTGVAREPLCKQRVCSFSVCCISISMGLCGLAS
jgi:hypothetical protein